MLAYDFFSFAIKVSFARKSRIQLTWILVHYWPMRVPVRLNFAKVCLNFFITFCSWLVTGWRFGCRYDLSFFSSLFHQRIRQESERKVSTESDQFSFKEKNKGAEFNILQKMCFSGKSWRGYVTKESCLVLIWYGCCILNLHQFHCNILCSLENDR